MTIKTAYLDDVIYKALKRRKRVELFLCNSAEGGFGIKIDGVVVVQDIPWECFEF